MQQPDVEPGTGPRARLDGLRRQLQPGVPRSEALAGLDRLFASGSPPDPAPDGFFSGSLVSTSLTPAVDATAQRIAASWMPWLGKSFDPGRQMGVNVLIPAARGPMRFLWPGYEPVSEGEAKIEAFAFRTRLAPGELDPETQVLKIDYDFEDNPGFVIRRILDELVRLDDGLYLGKILYRLRGRFARIGFFTLEASG